MTENLDFSLATSEQIINALCKRIENIRLSMNVTQAELAKKSGLTRLTIIKLENGKSVSLDTFIRVLIALRMQNNLETLLPDPTIRPIERVRIQKKERLRARPLKIEENKPTNWIWGDEKKKS